MPVASLSKAVTAVAVLQLVRDGRIGLDRPVSAQLPEFTTADPRSSRIRVRQLLNQTSGITGYRDLAVAQPSDLRGAVAALRDIRLGADPGTAYHYANVNYAIAARLVEAVPSGVLVATAVLTTGGRTTPWQTVLTWPALAVAIVVTVPSALAVLAARLHALRRVPPVSNGCGVRAGDANEWRVRAAPAPRRRGG